MNILKSLQFTHQLLSKFLYSIRKQIRKVTVGQDQSYKTSCLLNILLILLRKQKKKVYKIYLVIWVNYRQVLLQNQHNNRFV